MERFRQKGQRSPFGVRSPNVALVTISRLSNCMPIQRYACTTVEGPTDLRRDIIKSESSDVDVPELELHLSRGTLGGRVTTVEGLLCEVRTRASMLM